MESIAQWTLFFAYRTTQIGFRQTNYCRIQKLKWKENGMFDSEDYTIAYMLQSKQ